MYYKFCSTFALLYITFACQLSQPVAGLRDCLSIMDSVRSEAWETEELPCLDATLAMVQGVRNHTLWASWLWDSMQSPMGTLSGSRYHLGNFDQCLEAPWAQPWPSQYCLVEFQLTNEKEPYDGEDKNPYGNVGEFIGMETKLKRRLHSYFLGVCLPSVCSPSSVAKISRHLHQMTHLPLAEVTVDPSYCQVKVDKSYGVGFYLFWSILLLSGSIVTLAYFMEDRLSHPKLKQLTNWFSPAKNLDALTRTSPGELSSLNGLRVAAAWTAIVMHYFYYVAGPSAANPGDIEKDLGTTTGKYLIQLSLVIDTFFVMSGLLHIRGLMLNGEEPVKMLVKRYLRLLGPLALSILYLTAVLQDSVAGPLYPQLEAEQTRTCQNNWWLSLLMLNNYVRNEAICHTVSWYLSCDYQLTIFGTILFCICKKLTRSGVIKVFSTAFFVSMLIPGVLTFLSELPAVFLYNIEDAGDVKLNVVFLTTYMKSHSRASAYIIGLTLGYLIHLYKPKDYRKAVYKHLSILGGVLGISTLVAVMGTGGWLLSRRYHVLEATLYSMVDRSLWAVGVALIILVIEYGTFPIIGDLVSSKAFVSLSRLSYIGYLFHPMLLYKTLYSRRVPVAYSFFHHVMDAFGYIVIANTIAYVLWFLVEAPMSNMTNSLFKRSPKKTMNGVSSRNGSTVSICQAGNTTSNGTKIIHENDIRNGSTAIDNGTQMSFVNATNSLNHVGNGTKNSENGTIKNIHNLLVNLLVGSVKQKKM